MLNFKNNYSAKGYPIYTKHISNYSDIYILGNGEVYKNRGDRSFNLQEEIDNFNNIAIEQNGIVNIYCTKERKPLFEKTLKYLKDMLYSNADEFIKIHSEEV